MIMRPLILFVVESVQDAKSVKMVVTTAASFRKMGGCQEKKRKRKKTKF